MAEPQGRLGKLAPWSFEFLWSPLMDRYPVPVLGRKRGWILASQVALFAFGITLAASSSWMAVNAMLACCYAPLALVTWFVPEPEIVPEAPRTLRDAVWGPFFGFLHQHRALEILAFVILFKLSDNMTQGLLDPALSTDRSSQEPSFRRPPPLIPIQAGS